MIKLLCLWFGLMCSPAMAMPNFQTYPNVQYGLTPAESADLYLIEGGIHPLAVVVHGGGWTAGDKSSVMEFVVTFLQNGYSVLNVNYVLAEMDKPDTQWNIQIQGVQAAVRWIRTLALIGAINVNPNKIVAEGDSAGGHLAHFLGSVDWPIANTTPSPSRAGLYPGVSSKVNAVFSWEGPVDLTTPEGQYLMALPGATNLFGGKPYAGNEALYKDASPIFYMSPATAPTCIVFGTTDTTVSPLQQVELVQKLQSLGVPVNAIPFNGGHTLPPDPLGAQLIQKGINCIKNFGIR